MKKLIRENSNKKMVFISTENSNINVSDGSGIEYKEIIYIYPYLKEYSNLIMNSHIN